MYRSFTRVQSYKLAKKYSKMVNERRKHRDDIELIIIISLILIALFGTMLKFQ